MRLALTISVATVLFIGSHANAQDQADRLEQGFSRLCIGERVEAGVFGAVLEHPAAGLSLWAPSLRLAERDGLAPATRGSRIWVSLAGSGRVGYWVVAGDPASGGAEAGRRTSPDGLAVNEQTAGPAATSLDSVPSERSTLRLLFFWCAPDGVTEMASAPLGRR